LYFAEKTDEVAAAGDSLDSSAVAKRANLSILRTLAESKLMALQGDAKTASSVLKALLEQSSFLQAWLAASHPRNSIALR